MTRSFPTRLCACAYFGCVRKPLSMIYQQTGFRNATFLNSKSAPDIWNALVGCWSTSYVSFPQKTRSYQKSAITFEKFRDLATLHDIQLELSGVIALTSIGQWSNKKPSVTS